MKKKVLWLLAVLAMSVVIVACTSISNKEEDSVKTEEVTTKTKEESIKTEEIGTEIEKTTEDVALTGKVVVYMPSPAGLNEKYIAGFEEKTGVKVELFEGTTGKILARLEAEKDNPIADVVVLASWSDGLRLKDSGILQSYEPKNADKLYKGWIDEDSTLFGSSASALAVIYNTTLVEKLDADWNELAEEKYKDMVVIPDPEKSGSCKDFLSGYMYANGEEAWSTWENLAKNGMTVPGANKASLEAVTTGEKAILIAGVDYNAYSSINKGEPLGVYYPKSGTVINPRPAMILKTSQNLVNAQAFVDYLLSDEAQQMVADVYLLPGRSDVTCSNRSNVADIPTFDVDWNEMMKNASDIAARLNELTK